ncbi:MULTISPECIES: hypothetical protein [Nostocales]|uniref:hypothetical protein n=1 Tax=Nostocales TaxID=1161 RepID=UPI00168A079A|nr:MULTISPECIES: hypothetical protein [Nostocales]MBD2303764.1 hypothetical protein [Nostoc sp. FACHB-190]MBD2491140.1 hypothetical protein [Aulosira sp. FACHB-615]
MPLSNPSVVTVSTPTSSTSTPSSVSASTTSISLLASNSSRKGGTIWNRSTARLYIEFGVTASTSAFTAMLEADGYYEIPFSYTGTISGIWAAANGNALVRELT